MMVLEANNVTKEFLRKRADSNVFCAVKDADLALEEGKLTALAGRSGSGKSTLLHMLAGLLKPSSGRILLKGQDLYGLDDRTQSALRNKEIGIVPQGQSALQALTVRENIVMPFSLCRTGAPDDREITERAEALMKRLGITDLADAMPRELSGGELRRMAIARAAVMKPGIILADEPTADLDDENTKIVLDMLKELSREGTAVLLVTHERDALPYADEVYRMQDGKPLPEKDKN